MKETTPQTIEHIMYLYECGDKRQLFKDVLEEEVCAEEILRCGWCGECFHEDYKNEHKCEGGEG